MQSIAETICRSAKRVGKKFGLGPSNFRALNEKTVVLCNEEETMTLEFVTDSCCVISETSVTGFRSIPIHLVFIEFFVCYFQVHNISFLFKHNESLHPNIFAVEEAIVHRYEEVADASSSSNQEFCNFATYILEPQSRSIVFKETTLLNIATQRYNDMSELVCVQFKSYPSAFFLTKIDNDYEKSRTIAERTFMDRLGFTPSPGMYIYDVDVLRHYTEEIVG